MHILINGSQKIEKSNSAYFLKYITKNLEKYKIFNLKNDDYEDIINNIILADNVVIAFPLYADSPNTITLSFLDYIIDNNIPLNTNIYVIINCGFLESEHNLTALNIIKNWCLKVGTNYMGAVLIGAGEVAGNKKYRLISNKVFQNLKILSNNIKENTSNGDQLCTISLLKSKLYCLCANMSWNKSGYKNGLDQDDIKKE